MQSRDRARWDYMQPPVALSDVTTSRKLFVRIADLYFDEQPPELNADVARYVQWSRPIPQARWTSFCTIVIDLHKDPAVLMADMTANTRYEIRRAERDGLIHHASADCTPEVLREFCDFYDGFAALTGLRRVNRSRLKVLAACGVLYLSQVEDGSGNVLVWHAYWHAGRRVRLLHSAALHKAVPDASRRALIGRANRYHVWRDMLTFREAGFLVFDLGGWYAGTADHKRLAINWFKKGFGGEIVENFNGLRPLSLKGRMAVWVYERLGHGIASTTTACESVMKAPLV